MKRAKAAAKARAMAPVSLLPVRHDSRQQRRLRKHPEYVNAERIYAAAWKRLMRQHPDWLHRILAPDGCDYGVVSPRDAEVVASIVQWLGTNVGGSFVRDVEKAVYEAVVAGRDRRLEAWLRKANKARSVASEPTAPRTRMIDVAS